MKLIILHEDDREMMSVINIDRNDLEKIKMALTNEIRIKDKKKGKKCKVCGFVAKDNHYLKIHTSKMHKRKR